MIGEINFFGIYISSFIPCLVVGIIFAYLVQISMKKRNLYRFVWQPSLFDLAVEILCISMAVGILKIINITISYLT